jgi:hypothetical protein
MSLWARADLREAFGRQLELREAAIAGVATPLG